MELLIIILLVFGWLAGAILFRGWVLSVMWGWFIVPFGAPDLSVAWAIGISAIVGMFTGKPSDSDDKKDLVKQLINPFIQGLLILGVGWIAHSAM